MRRGEARILAIFLGNDEVTNNTVEGKENFKEDLGRIGGEEK